MNLFKIQRSAGGGIVAAAALTATPLMQPQLVPTADAAGGLVTVSMIVAMLMRNAAIACCAQNGVTYADL